MSRVGAAGEARPAGRLTTALLLVSLALLSACTVAFELNLVAFIGYEVSDQLLILSAMVGLYLFFMGIGAWLSRTAADPALAYIGCCVAAAVFGGLSVGLLTSVYYGIRSFWPAVVLLTALVAGPCGAALPLAVRTLSAQRRLQVSLAESLGLDYAGALAGALAYSWWLLPAMGLVERSAFIGAATLGAGLLAFPALRRPAAAQRIVPVAAVAAGLLVLAGWKLPGWVEGIRDRHQQMQTVFVQRTPYQEIRVRRGSVSERLFLNNQVQYDSMAEYIYHELLVHPTMALHGRARRLLLLGGGDGLALREIWKYRDVRKVTQIDIDPAMTRFGRTYPGVVALNRRSYEDPRLRVIHEDAWKFVERTARRSQHPRYDVVISDLPSPTNISLSRLYTVTFYRRLRKLLAPGGLLVIQSGSIDHREAGVPFCVLETLRAAGMNAAIFHSELLAYTLASNGPLSARSAGAARPKLRVKTRYLSEAMWPALFEQPHDLRGGRGEVNTLETHAVLKYSTW